MTIEIKELIKASVEEALRSNKLKPEAKAYLGMRYVKFVEASVIQKGTFELLKVSTAVQVAGLYDQAKREEIAHRILPSLTKAINIDTQSVSREEYRKLMEDMNATRTENQAKIQNLELENQNLESKNTRLTNRLEDIQDDINRKEKPKLEEAARKEYDLKRNY